MLAEEVYLAVKKLEERGTTLSKLLADQLEADPVGTLTKLKRYLPVERGRGGDYLERTFFKAL